ncbi:VapE domain-containing protein [Stenotrophomonas sp. LARHCG68]
MTEPARKGLKVIKGGGGTPPPGEGERDDTWRIGLTRNRENNVEGTLHNLILIMENDERLRGLWWLNESSNQIELTREGPWSGSSTSEFIDADSYELAAWFQNPDRYQMKCSDELVLKAVIAVARRYRRHPVREYLSAIVWDGVPRVERMLIDLFGAPDDAYSRRAALCFAVSAVSRVLWADPKNPALGAKVDFMLVLEGEQGKSKSTSLMELFGSTWFVETNESPSSKDFYQVIQGAWAVEIGEMDSFGKADVTAVKTLITRRVDKFRAPYERVPRSYRRECVFVGTTNEHEYLRDPTGGRRFLPVRTDGSMQVELIREQRDQLWAEAVQLFRQGVKWWELPDDAAEQQEERYIGDSWEGRIALWLSGRAPSRKNGDSAYPQRNGVGWGEPAEWTTTDEVLFHAIDLDRGKHGRPEQMRIAAIMKRLKWEQHRVEVDGFRERRWRPTEAARKAMAARPPAAVQMPAEGDDLEPDF